MSAATAPATLHNSRAATRRHSLQDRAWDLSCQGLRGPAIADLLGVPERTVRSWLAAIRREVAEDMHERHADDLLLAVESIRHVAATAWDAYERETARDTPSSPSNTAATTPIAPTAPRRASYAPRYLTLAAHVQTARLLGLYLRDVKRALDAALTELATPDEEHDSFNSPESAETAEFVDPATHASEATIP